MNSRPPALWLAAVAITSSVQPSTRAVTRPTRRLVYGPGPVPTAIEVRSRGAAPATASTRWIDGVSSSPWRRASTADSCASTPEPSCSATVTAGVAVSKARISTVSQRSHPDRLAGPSERRRPRPLLVAGSSGVGSADGYADRPTASADGRTGLDGGEQLLSHCQRSGPQLADRDWAEAAALLRLQAGSDQHVPISHQDGDPVRGQLAVKDLQRAERLLAEPGNGRDDGRRVGRALGRLDQELALLGIGIGGVGCRAAVLERDVGGRPVRLHP